ncbi:MAG TPA: hypothetical protein EYO33_32015 [Phycisphaerales bacterium]|nr:hypothetical protein [Phycisphaerales bacterium]
MPRCALYLRNLVVLALLLTLGASAQEMKTRIFVLNARPAEATVEMVQPLLSPQGKVIPDTRLNKLVVRDTPQVLAEIEELLQQIDVHMPQVRINVNMHGVARENGNQAGVSVSGRAGSGIDDSLSVSGRAVKSSGSSQMESRQSLLVMSGEKGIIHVSRDVVNFNPLQQFATQSGFLPPTFLVQQVGTGFAVEPVVVGEVVRIKITPWMSFLGPNGGTDVRVDEASSTFAVKSGQTITVSSGGYKQEMQNRAFGLIMGSQSMSGSRSSRITLTPVVVD